MQLDVTNFHRDLLHVTPVLGFEGENTLPFLGVMFLDCVRGECMSTSWVAEGQEKHV